MEQLIELVVLFPRALDLRGVWQGGFKGRNYVQQLYDYRCYSTRQCLKPSAYNIRLIHFGPRCCVGKMVALANLCKR